VRENLAEQLLGIVLGWDTPTAKEEIGKLRYLSSVKYDSYHNFEPGRRFMESLVLWLRNFKTIDERRVAYRFIMNRMLYISESQMDHLVGLLYPQRVLPILLEEAKEKLNFFSYQIKRIRNSETFQVIRRKTLFFGMSDGARMDAFRRKTELDHDQVSVSYELSKEKCERMQKALKKWLVENNIKSEAAFENVFLIDDFSGSGNSILRLENNTFKGKLPQFLNESFQNGSTLRKWCIEEGPKLFVATYLSTETAIKRLRKDSKKLIQSYKHLNLASCCILDPLQKFEDNIKVPQPNNNDDQAFDRLLNAYYDDRLEDEHTETGGKDVKHGYAGCALPLVLFHNCPNNSVYLLWAKTEELKGLVGLNALFPRISRHLEAR